MAMITSRFPYMFFLAFIYLTMVYLMTNQPLELFRFAMLFLIAILTAQISDSLGMLIASRLSLVVSNSKVVLNSCQTKNRGRSFVLEIKDFVFTLRKK